MSKCGSCTLCCKLPGVEEIEKPASEWCKHCSPGKGCQIYDSRPPNCRNFECGWLANDGTPEMRPDKIHMIVTGESVKLDAYVVHVDPGFPDAPNRPKGEALLRTLTSKGRHPNVVLVTGERRRFLGKNPTSVQTVLEAAEKAGVGHLA